MNPEELPDLPGYRMNEYLVMLNPGEELQDRIGALRKKFAEDYRLPVQSGKVSICLIRFKQMAMMEDRIVNRLAVAGKSQQPVMIELNDFGSNPSHTIYINVLTRGPLQELVKKIRAFQKLLKPDNDNKPHFIEDPHIIIASRLLPWQYEKAWLEYSHSHFFGRFIAGSYTLLKRHPGEKSFRAAGNFKFMSEMIESRQGDLF